MTIQTDQIYRHRATHLRTVHPSARLSLEPRAYTVCFDCKQTVSSEISTDQATLLKFQQTSTCHRCHTVESSTDQTMYTCWNFNRPGDTVEILTDQPMPSSTDQATPFKFQQIRPHCMFNRYNYPIDHNKKLFFSLSYNFIVCWL